MTKRMIDLKTENAKSLAKAAKTLPGGAVHVSTIHRWDKTGIRGIKLETFLRGGIRYTTDEAIERFLAATTAAADGESPVTARTTRARQKSIAAAEKELAEAGI